MDIVNSALLAIMEINVDLLAQMAVWEINVVKIKDTVHARKVSMETSVRTLVHQAVKLLGVSSIQEIVIYVKRDIMDQNAIRSVLHVLTLIVIKMADASMDALMDIICRIVLNHVLVIAIMANVCRKLATALHAILDITAKRAHKNVLKIVITVNVTKILVTAWNVRMDIMAQDVYKTALKIVKRILVT